MDLLSKTILKELIKILKARKYPLEKLIDLVRKIWSENEFK